MNITLDWSFLFIKITDKSLATIQYVLSFRNGLSQLIANRENFPEVITQMESIATLLSYIAYFPNKDFTKIKLDTSGSHYALHFLDKRHLEKGFLGILSVSEYDQRDTYGYWGIEEMMAEFVFDHFNDLIESKGEDSFSIFEFNDWLATEIKEFYVEWYDAKKEYKEKLTENENQDFNVVIEKKNGNSERKFEQYWDIQLINEFGNPMTDLISFIDDNAFLVPNESERISQSLESMSLSALKILIDQQEGWNIKYIKNRLKNEMGYAYIFFGKFSIGDIKYLLIMNSSIYDFDTDVCLQAFRGNEFHLLNSITHKLEKHKEIFSKDGQISDDARDSIQNKILEYIKDIYT